jgi:ferredoxin
MAHVITKGCIECGRCKRECPEKAIYKGINTSVIDPNRCTDCGACVGVCPLELIAPDFLAVQFQ